MTTAPLSVLIVDDEPLARRRLMRLLAGETDVECVAECQDGQAAVEWLAHHAVDVVLLDVQMPGLSGLDVIDMVGTSTMPLVVFVTAFDRYAVQAFDRHAVDYVLKPFDRARLRLALGRARQRLAQEPHSALVARLDNVLRDIADRRDRPDRLVVRRPGAISFVTVGDIDWIEAQGNYVALHVGTQNHVIRDTLSRLEQRLDGVQFVRVRRTAIVNVNRIARLEPWEKDEHVCVMMSGARIAVSRGFSDRLERVLEAWRV